MRKISDLLTVEQAAKELKVKPTTIREWLKKGDIKGIKISREWRIKKSDIQELKEKGLTIDKTAEVEINLQTVKEIISNEMGSEVRAEMSDKAFDFIAMSVFESLRIKKATLPEAKEAISNVVKKAKIEGYI